VGALEHLQSRFLGEISPRLKGRVETEVYKNALDECLNWEPTPQGSLMRAPGSTFKSALPGIARILPFRVQSGQDYLVALGDQTISIYNSDGSQEQMGLVAGYLTNGAFDSGSLASWSQLRMGWALSGGSHYAQDAGTTDAAYTAGAMDGVDGYAKLLCNVSGPSGGLRQKITLPSPGDYVLSITVRTLVNSAAAVRIALGTTPGGYEINDGHTYDSWGYGGLDLAAGRYNLTFTLPAGDVYLTVLCLPYFNLGQWMPAERLLPGYAAIDDLSVRDAVGASVDAAPWTAGQAGAVQWAALTGEDKMVLVHPEVPPQEIVRNNDGTWTLSAITFLNPPPDDKEVTPSTPAWTGTTYPGVVEIWQGRLWLSGWSKRRNRIWASRVGIPYDFATEEEVPAGSGNMVSTARTAIDEELATKGGIMWLRGRQFMLVGTDLGDGSIGSQSGMVSAVDMQFKAESNFASAPVMPCDIGNQVVYVSSDRRKIRAINYHLDENSWLSADLTFVAEHITAGGVAEIAFARDPNGTLVALMQDGTLVCCTYDRRQEVIAWWTRRRSTATETVDSMCVLDGPYGSIVMLLVQVGGVACLECIQMSETGGFRAYCDSAVKAQVGGISAHTMIPGFTHLASRTVDIVVDGACYSGTVTAGGAVELPATGSEMIVGLPYRSTARTLPPEVRSANGTIQRGRTRWVKGFARLNDSDLPIISDRRAPAPRGYTAGDQVTDDVGPCSTDWEQGGRLLIEQDRPLRTEVLAVFGSLQNQEV
jgi:hypothetical protein